jgi:hypothetical protein
MSQLASRTFWVRVAERAVKTVAQTAVALIGAQAFDVLSFDWQGLASVAVGAGIVSVLTSIASSEVGDPEDPSLV